MKLIREIHAFAELIRFRFGATDLEEKMRPRDLPGSLRHSYSLLKVEIVLGGTFFSVH